MQFPRRQKEAAWWVKIATEMPHCTYYFGPFDSVTEANETQPGYVEDLEREGAKGITVDISQSQPKTLTICEGDE